MEWNLRRRRNLWWKDSGPGCRELKEAGYAAWLENEFTVSIAEPSRQHRQPDGFNLSTPPGWREQRPSRASPVKCHDTSQQIVESDMGQ